MELTAGMFKILDTHEKMQLQYIPYTSTHKCFTASDKQCMIAHLRPSMHLRLCAMSEKIYHAQFFFTNKPNPKNGTSS